eukprot:TRINITY_DN32858_c0_g1_i1.p1 TRINITY_DN32858_c0_g1~~TRINITY_DN32858_c0_g1_i1.p1  ORF type:complete len:331 (+),score=49.71 TRINITY_DN32858_c0_g1_i1:47-994(+)
MLRHLSKGLCGPRLAAGYSGKYSTVAATDRLFHPDLITPDFAREILLVSDAAAIARFSRGLINYRRWVVPVPPSRAWISPLAPEAPAPNGATGPDSSVCPFLMVPSSAIKTDLPSARIFTSPREWDQWRRQGASIPLIADAVPLEVDGLELTLQLALFQQQYKEVRVDTGALLWLDKSTAPSVFALCNQMIVEKLLYKLSEKQAPSLAERMFQGSYILYNHDLHVGDDGAARLHVFTDVQCLLTRYPQALDGAETGAKLSIFACSGRELILKAAELTAIGAVFNPGTPIATTVDFPFLGLIPGYNSTAATRPAQS